MSFIRFSATPSTPSLSQPLARFEAASAPDSRAIAQSSKQQLGDLGAHVQATVTQISNLPPNADPSAYGQAAKQVSDLILGIRDSGVGLSELRKWQVELRTALKDQIAVQKAQQPPSTDSQQRIDFLNLMLLGVESLTQPSSSPPTPQPPQQPPQPPQQPPQPLLPAPANKVWRASTT
jgi:hypothetical protein